LVADWIDEIDEIDEIDGNERIDKIILGLDHL
jgi:hypothetical protein